MRRLRIGIAALLVALGALAPCHALAAPGVIFVVRHAEKSATGKDPALSPEGEVRADNIATIVHKAGITAIFSSPAQRARQTAEAVKRRTGVAVQVYDPSAPQVLVDKLKSLHGAVLVVGHSNTVPALVRLLGGEPGADIAEHEFDRLYQLFPASGGAVTTILLTSPPLQHK